MIDEEQNHTDIDTMNLLNPLLKSFKIIGAEPKLWKIGTGHDRRRPKTYKPESIQTIQ